MIELSDLHRRIMRSVAWGFCGLFLISALCRPVPLEERVVVYFTESSCLNGAVFKPAALVNHEWYTPDKFSSLDPPFGAGDCVAFRDRGLAEASAACCVRDSTKERLCEHPEPGPRPGPCRRIFDEGGSEFSTELVAKWNGGA